MKSNPSLRLRIAFIALCISGTLFATAQHANAQTPSSGNPALAAPTDDEIIVMSPFEVSASSRQSDYIASEATTGSRVSTKIIDLPYTVNVITSEFMDDFDFFDMGGGSRSYTSSLTSEDMEGNTRMRGFEATFQLRNGFYRLGLNDRINTDRKEVIKGPNAAIYGQCAPSGLVNYISKRPRSSASQMLRLTAGSDGLFRAETNINGPVPGTSGKLTHLFSAQATTVDSPVEGQRNTRYTLSESLLWKITPSSVLLAELEWSKSLQTGGGSDLPYYTYDPLSGEPPRHATQYAYTNQWGTDSFKKREMTSLNLLYENRLSRIFSTRIAANGYYRDAPQWAANQSGDILTPATVNGETHYTVSRSDPIYSVLTEKGIALQGDILAHYFLLDGNIEGKTLFTLDVTKNWRARTEKKMSKNTAAALGFDNVLDLDTRDYYLPGHTNADTITRDDDTNYQVFGFYMRQQASFMKGKILAFAGLRYDSVKFNNGFGDQYSNSGDGTTLGKAGYTDRFTDTAWTPHAGINYKYLPNLALFFNYSRSFKPHGQDSKLGDPRLPNERGTGYDYGFKVSLLEERLIFTVSGFYIDLEGTKVTDKDPTTGMNETSAGGEQLARGAEIDFTWSVTKNFDLLGGYGYVNATMVNYGTANPWAVGGPIAKVPGSNAGLAGKYKFTGDLAGLAINLGISYTGSAYPEAQASSRAERRTLRVPGYYTVDGGISYTFKTAARLQHQIRFSAKNLLDERYVTERGAYATPRAFYFAYAINH